MYQKTVVIEKQAGASTFVREGWANVFKAIGYQVVDFWADQNVSVHDLFNSLPNIDIFLGTTYNLNRALINQILKRPNMKVGLYCSAHGSLVNDIGGTARYPIQVATDDEIKNVDTIKNRVSFCHIHIPDQWVDSYIGRWTSKLGIPTIGIMNGADLFVYSRGTPKHHYACDIGYVGGLWPYKGENLNKTLVKLARELRPNLNLKIFGNGWDVPQSLGTIEFGEDAHVFASSKICPNISEPHSYQFPDLVERLFKVPVAGGFVISDQVQLKHSIGCECIPQFNSDDYESFLNTCFYYLEHESERKKLAAQQKKFMWANHSYFERVMKMLRNFGLNEDADKCIIIKNQLFPL